MGFYLVWILLLSVILTMLQMWGFTMLLFLFWGLCFLFLLYLYVFFSLAIKEFSNKNIEVIEELSKQVQKWIFIINLPLLVLMILFPGVFINLLFGAQYINAEIPLRFLAIAFFNSTFHQPNFYEGKIKNDPFRYNNLFYYQSNLECFAYSTI
jgi:hypothetical protein